MLTQVSQWPCYHDVVRQTQYAMPAVDPDRLCGMDSAVMHVSMYTTSLNIQTYIRWAQWLEINESKAVSDGLRKYRK